ncbi:hypothetical protein GGR54DRAFT_620413 [Hypoxylon sp. NC1633]|nr:hypothetical protein GGR54DRAFT_620413 [Hypoxylon sp. NC1633]
MPKKRHYNKYSKPPSVAPPSLTLSSSSHSTSEHHERSVNQLLAEMRRANLSSVGQDGPQNNITIATPTVPPPIRQLLQIPETPAPAPRRPQRRDANGRLVPPGPPPPRSWLPSGQSRHSKLELGGSRDGGRVRPLPLPGAYTPGRGSLVDLVLRQMALDWDEQRQWNKFYLYTLPSHLRMALPRYVLELYEPGLTIKDLRLVLAGPTDEELAQYDVEKPDLNIVNADVSCLDLSGALGKVLTLKQLTALLFPPQVVVDPDLQDTWDAPEPTAAPVDKLLPNLTQLSLAVDPTTWPCGSWKQLLSLASKLPTLTSLNLSGWPVPSYATNQVDIPRIGSAWVAGTSLHDHGGFHSHDPDWFEAISVLRRLGKSLYSLEYLDLTGCSEWIPALRTESDSDLGINSVDWVLDWGKITTLRLCSGYYVPAENEQLRNLVAEARAIELHIRAKRLGRGRWITVEKDAMPDMNWQARFDTES